MICTGVINLTKASYSMILETYCQNHQHTMEFAEKLTNAQLTWHAAPGTLSIAFFLWHVARWADHLQSAIPGMTLELSRQLPPGHQLWETGEYAVQWGFDTASTGFAETGMEMDESDAARLVFPSKHILLDYVRRSFSAAELAVSAIEEDQFLAYEQPQSLTEGVWSEGGTVGDAVMSHLVHAARHLGMMECLLGLQTGSGTASV
jgi:hypothetical protein